MINNFVQSALTRLCCSLCSYLNPLNPFSKAISFFNVDSFHLLTFLIKMSIINYVLRKLNIIKITYTYT